MKRGLITAACSLALMTGAATGQEPRPEIAYDEIDLAPHEYWKRPLKDPFTQFKTELEAGRVQLDQTGEKPFLRSLLQALHIPASSQMLVFSTTSLQLRFITPSNPRAIYFSEDVYVGYIPGGKIEIVSLDPELGAVFFIFDIPRGGDAIRVDRSNKCMNCHAAEDTGHVPGLLVKSVVPGPGGGSLKAFRIGQMGHGIPLSDRFGGWYVTGAESLTNHWGNIVGRSSPQGLTKTRVEPGKTFDFGKYLVPSSDVLPQLLHEHQAGFVNRVVEATYRTRAYLHHGKGGISGEQKQELDRQAELIVRYLLFADEAPLSPGGVPGDDAFKADFLRDRRVGAGGASLKDFDLQTRLFRHRCSYMIYSGVFQGLPAEMKQRVYQRLSSALRPEKSDPGYAYLPVAEKRAIRGILKETVKDLPKQW